MSSEEGLVDRDDHDSAGVGLLVDSSVVGDRDRCGHGQGAGGADRALAQRMAAILGWFVGLIAGVIALGPKNAHPLLLIPLVVFFGVLAALPMAIVLDVTTRRRVPRRRGRPTLRHPVRAVRSVFAPLGRFREVLGNARRENLLHVRSRTRAALSSPDLARRVRLVLEQSGGMFVKFGQIAATRKRPAPRHADHRAVTPARQRGSGAKRPTHRGSASRAGGADRASVCGI